MLQEYKIQDGESAFDVVLKLYGSMELYGHFIQDNIDSYQDFEIIVTTQNGISFFTSGDYTWLFYAGSKFIYNGVTYNVILSSFIDPYTYVQLDPSGSTLPYGPGPATFSLLSQKIPPSVIVYDSSLYVSSPPELTRSSAIPSTIRTLKGQDGQSVYDICMMAYGDIGELYRLLQDSGIASINEASLADTLFTYDTTFIADSTFYNYITSEEITINTGEGSIDTDEYVGQQNYYLLLQENGYGITIP